MDYAVRLISLEDNPTLPIFTFRMWFLALGMSCFGAVLSQIFVSIMFSEDLSIVLKIHVVLPSANNIRQSTVFAGA
jgi:hypothetical protein